MKQLVSDIGQQAVQNCEPERKDANEWAGDHLSAWKHFLYCSAGRMILSRAQWPL